MVRKRVISEQEYLNRKGVGSPLSGVMDDRLRSVRQLRSTRGEEKFNRDNKSVIDSYHTKRSQAKREYQRLVSSGKVRPPSNAEKAWKTAHGLSENRAVQAARRVLAKHGVDWKTGKRIGTASGRGLWPLFVKVQQAAEGASYV